MTKTETGLRIVPANEASWDDLNAVLGTARCYETLCFCQRLKIPSSQWRTTSDEERAHRLRQQTDCGHPGSEATTGLVAYLGDEPVGWCAVEPRTAYVKLPRMPIPWAERNEDKDDASVWAVTCFVTRTAHRWTGVMTALTLAAVDYARERGARVLEGYPMITEPGKVITWGELHVGSRDAFAAAGFKQVTQPTKRRAVMRLDL